MLLGGSVTPETAGNDVALDGADCEFLRLRKARIPAMMNAQISNSVSAILTSFVFPTATLRAGSLGSVAPLDCVATSGPIANDFSAGAVPFSVDLTSATKR